MPNGCWRFAIDVGGTFTDCLAVRPDGTNVRHKLLSSGVTHGLIGSGSSVPGEFIDPARRSDPAEFWVGYEIHLRNDDGEILESGRVVDFDATRGSFRVSPILRRLAAGVRYELCSDEEAPLIAVRHILGLRRGDPIPSIEMRLGTTRGTNALLTRTGARTAFVTTRGFRDILEIRDQQRCDLFALNVVKPENVYECVIEANERVAADGTVLVELDVEHIRRELATARGAGIESVAVCLMHAYSFPSHEQRIGRIANELEFPNVSLSSETAPVIKLVSRSDTTVASAYLNPVLQDYLGRIRTAIAKADDDFAGCPFRLLTSSGGLVPAEQFDGKGSVLSGPAGGVVGYARAAEAAGFRRAIGFDMGGTSTDVSRYSDGFDMVHETEKNGVRIVAPMMAIETVAAGGGSICDFDGVQLTVGPGSAGADPGPACYGRGGPLTITDLNVALGRIQADRFPFPLDIEVVYSRLSDLCRRIANADGDARKSYAPLELAEGFLRIANANMARAIRSISTARGYDPRAHVLVPFGGAAGQHACAVARELQVSTILCLPDASILSAVGISQADVTRHEVRAVYQSLQEAAVSCLGTISALREVACRHVSQQGISARNISSSASLDLRYLGQDASIEIPFDGSTSEDMDEVRHQFHAAHRKLYGFAYVHRPIELVAIRMVATGKVCSASRATATPDVERLRGAKTNLSTELESKRRFARVTFDGEAHDTPVYPRSMIQAGDVVAGPAIITEPMSTTVVEHGWKAARLEDGQLLLVDAEPINGQSLDKPAASKPRKGRSIDRRRAKSWDPVLLEVFANAFTGIAEQMGATLRKTASSVNVKERLDYSCAMFTAEGDLVVNAPHMPVHLGAMSETVRHVIADHPQLRPGDVLVTNDPYRGGSHLPDITVITPLFEVQSGDILMFTASRAHHAEIGGIVPGSMPPFSKCLAEEGVLIRSQKVVDRGQSRFDAIRELLSSGEYPSREVENNLADLAAQVAANQQGVSRLESLVERYGRLVVLDYMNHIQRTAEQKVRQALQVLPDGCREFEDALDDGAAIRVAVTIKGDSAEIDFAGTAAEHSGNLNANPAIVRAAVIYVMRLLIGQATPLNDGMFKPLTIRIPPGMLNPQDCGDATRNAAIVGGNVETSQRVVDVLLGAFGLAAASQGTMNNFTFGNDSFGYYETICGGTGATATANGADAVHSHMTNTRLTDPEVLEHRFPVRLRRFEIRKGSGGAGKQRGGDGVIREIEFLDDLHVSLLTERRLRSPYGLQGGSAGMRGLNWLIDENGKSQELAGHSQLVVQPGSCIRIETPGGGGFGEA